LRLRGAVDRCGAGTGKTKTLVHRVAPLILGGADPSRLLLLTLPAARRSK
jgi:superfamily I DNA/RNA helicase